MHINHLNIFGDSNCCLRVKLDCRKVLAQTTDSIFSKRYISWVDSSCARKLSPSMQEFGNIAWGEEQLSKLHTRWSFHSKLSLRKTSQASTSQASTWRSCLLLCMFCGVHCKSVATGKSQCSNLRYILFNTWMIFTVTFSPTGQHKEWIPIHTIIAAHL